MEFFGFGQRVLGRGDHTQAVAHDFFQTQLQGILGSQGLRGQRCDHTIELTIHQARYQVPRRLLGEPHQNLRHLLAQSNDGAREQRESRRRTHMEQGGSTAVERLKLLAGIVQLVH